MDQTHHLPDQLEQRMLPISVPDVDTPNTNTLHDDSAWNNGDTFQEGMDMNTFPHVDMLPFTNLGPVQMLVHYETDSRSHMVPSPTWPFSCEFFDGNLFEQHSAANLNTDNQVSWNTMGVVQEDLTSGPESKRQRIDSPDANMPHNFGQLSFEIGSQPNVNSASDSGYGTSIATAKHMTRHKRAFSCTEPSCTRKRGFGTINDLERHKKSVHGIGPTHGKLKEFKCFAKNCARKEKIWPRQDNFIQHLVRMHKEEDATELLAQSNAWFESTKESKPNKSAVHSLPSCLPQQEVIDPKSYRPRTLPEAAQLDDRQSYTFEAVSKCNGMSSNNPKYPQGIESGQRSHPNDSSFNDNVNPISVEVTTEYLSHPLLEHDKSQEDMDNSRDNIELHQSVDRSTEPGGGHKPSSLSFPKKNQGDLPPSYFDSVREAVLGLFKALGRDVTNSTPAKPRNGNGPTCDDVAASALQLASLPAYVDLLNNGSKKSRDNTLRELLKASLKHLEASRLNEDVPSPEKTPTTSKNEALRIRGKKTFVCRYEGCTRETARLSDLKKHEKRHSRPYGCTHPRCFKSFGSKNDWKRHENTQHFQLRCWRCPVKHTTRNNVASRDETLMERPDREDFPPAIPLRRTDCARLFDRKDKFYQHLRSEHLLDDQQTKQTARHNEIGRNGQFQFWCGFCCKLIQLRKEGMDAWDERFDHIDNEHFKKKQNIGAWVHPEGHLTKQCEEKADMASDTLETSNECEGVEEVDASFKRNDSVEDLAKDVGSVSRTMPVFIQTPAANSNCGRSRLPPAPGAIDRPVTGVAVQTNPSRATKRKHAATLESPLPDGNCIVTHRPSSFNSALMMSASQLQIQHQQHAAVLQGKESDYYMPVNSLVLNDDYDNLHGLIPIENSFPQSAIITCVWYRRRENVKTEYRLRKHIPSHSHSIS
ncbi:C2H2 zinc finger domain-containing protein [Histoplasma capsulatum var. duboisii H88]|uniref:C2H2 zinc finger domain-containing protein n=1 Tax=Ajellomyces capsulatus (strain H88) TaxID=544711 RepID=F0UE75_AJEC8|nr:C2H2 zinc finger domain-containing protein [Histoplasma capsulatum var. duboisii H88]